MNIVISLIKENISSQKTNFVFPSQTAADLWARKTCTLGISRSVAAGRFLAWDRFKEGIIEEKQRQPVSAVMRKLFAESLVRKNAEACRNVRSTNAGGSFPFNSIIPAEHSANGGVFAPFIARLLPALASWETAVKKKGYCLSPEDNDYALIKKEFGAFMERHELFEPSWEKNKIKKKIIEGKTNYIIFFPELIEDFTEYEPLLKPPCFKIITGDRVTANAHKLTLFQSARDEIRSAVLKMQKIHADEGVPYEDMAVSVPELEEMEPCLLKEFRLRHIPFTRRAGRPLGETGAGRLFRLINECAASGFAFTSLKALILNDHIPWKDMEKNQALVRFGIEYNCVSGYLQNGKQVDIWEEAFKELTAQASSVPAHNDKYRGLRSYYGDLKKRLLAFTGAKTFKDIRKHYFGFRGDSGRGGFLDMENISAEDNAVLGRCIEELSSLIELEEKFDDPGLVPSSPFGFFISCLNEKEYVMANQKPGVNVFKWRVAAASPFDCHFALNASQSAASVLYQPLKFLREDKRKALGINDMDASAAFFTLCGIGSGADDCSAGLYISASSQTFSGWAIPHSFFAGRTINALPIPAEPYQEERGFWRTLQSNAGLEKIYPVQKLSFDNWKETLNLKENNFSFFTSTLPRKLQPGVSAENPVIELIKNALPQEDGVLTVTPTNDLNVFFMCPVLWLYKRIFKTDKFSLDAALLDDIALGLLYHRILEALFLKIKNHDKSFDSSRLDTYKEWAFEASCVEIKKQRVFKGPLAIPLVLPLARGISKRICALLKNEAKFFDNYKVLELELPVNYSAGGLRVKGIIDRVSVSPEGEPVIIDYKSRYLPDQTAPEDIEDTYLSEFQMPLYIKLYEEKIKNDGGAHTVSGAYFYSIAGRNIKAVVGEKSRAGSKALSREEYAPFLEAAEEQINEFGQKAKSYNFVPPEIRFSDCINCMYKTVCRTTFSSRPDRQPQPS